MKFENGLPLPGPELDAYIVGHVFGWTDGPHTFYKWADRKQKRGPILVFHEIPGKYLDYTVGEHGSGSYVSEDSEKFRMGKPKEIYIPRSLSTTAASFAVMEAIEGFFEFFQHDRFIVGWHRDPDKPFDSIRVAIPYLDTLEQTFAWGLCAVVWKGKTNEG